MNNFLSFFIEPMTYDFMQRALLMSVLIAVVCSTFSCFLILKGWSLMGDAVAHAILPGLGVATLIGIPIAIGALFAGIFCAVVTGYIKENCRVKEDAVMGIMFSGMFALGLILLTMIETDVHLLHVLFGSVLGISNADLFEAGSIAIICSTIMLIKRKDIMLYCFDPAHAAVIGLPIRLLHLGLLIFLALTIVSSLKAAGIILVIAMLIAPGAIGFTLARTLDNMLIIALSVSVVSCIIGTILSFHLDAATAPLIVVIQATFFVLAMTVGRRQSTEKRLQNAVQSANKGLT